MLRSLKGLGKTLRDGFEKIDWPQLDFDADDKIALESCGFEKITNSGFTLNTSADKALIEPSQTILYAIYLKEMAYEIKSYLDIIEKLRTLGGVAAAEAVATQDKSIPVVAALDEYSKNIFYLPFNAADERLGAKEIITKDKVTSAPVGLRSDLMSSIILKCTNLTAVGSSGLPIVISKLQEHKEIYDYFEKKYLSKISLVRVSPVINRFVHQTLTFLYQYDGLIEFISVLSKNSSDANNLSVDFDGNRLTSIFKMSTSVLTSEQLTQGEHVRYFEDPIFYIDGNYYYLSTQWTDGTASRLDLVTFEKILNILYPGFQIIRTASSYTLTAKSNDSSLPKSKLSILQALSSFESIGLKISKELLFRFLSSLATKPFVIFTGLSGSGKTKIAQAFSTWISSDANQVKIIPVGADWTNREPLLGYPNSLDSKEYVIPDSSVINLVERASANPNAPYFLILDEMNLSHVERYFSDFLSLMESGGELKLHSSGTPINGVNSSIKMPKNLFIIGTVNIDETTYMFSPKVLDRAGVIEFRVNSADMESFLASPVKPEIEKIAGHGASMAVDFVRIATESSPEYTRKKDLNTELLKFFVELKAVGAEFGYRTAFEINRFAGIISSLSDDKYGHDNIVDAAIVQKLLPKLHGSQRKLTEPLKSLAKLCLNENSDFSKMLDTSYVELSEAQLATIKYPISFEKIHRMYTRAKKDGFTSFAEA